MANNKVILEIAADTRNAIKGVQEMSNSIVDLKNKILTFGGASTGVMKAVKVAVASTGIGLLIVAVASLIAYFTKSEEGAKKMKIIFAQIGAVVDVLVSYFVTLGKVGFNSIIGVVHAVEWLWAKLTGTSKEAESAAKSMKESFSKAGEAITEFTNKIKNVGKEISIAAENAEKLVNMQSAYDKAARQSLTTLASLEKALSIQNAIADDATKGFAEREKAANKTGELEIQISKEKLRLAEKQLAYDDLALKTSKTYNKELLDNQAASKAAFISAQQAVVDATYKSGQRIRDINKDNIQAQLDSFDKAKDANNSLLNQEVSNNKKTYEDKISYLNKIKESNQKATDESIQLLNKSAKSNIDINELIAISDEKKLNDKIRSYGLGEALELKLQDIVKRTRDDSINFASVEKTLSDEKINNLKSISNIQKSLSDDQFQNEKDKTIRLNELSLIAQEDEISRLNISEEKKKKLLEEFQIKKQESIDLLNLEWEEKEALRKEEDDLKKHEEEIEKLTVSETEKNALKEQLYDSHKQNLANIDAKYDLEEIKVKKQAYKSEKELQKTKQKFKLENAADTAGQLSEILGKETAAGKAAAIAQTTIETYMSATKSYSSLSGIPVVGPALGVVAAAAAVTAGLANVKKITSVPNPETSMSVGKFALGGPVIGGSHASGGVRLEAEGGEFIVNKRTMANPEYASAIMGMNSAGNGGIINGGSRLTEERVVELATNVVRSIPVYVTEGEITDIQRKVKLRESSFSA